MELTTEQKRKMIHHALLSAAVTRRTVSCGRAEKDRDQLLLDAKQYEDLAKEYE